MDIEKIKLQEGDKYHKLVIKILEDIVNELIECEEFEAMEKSKELMIFAGEYKDEVELLYENEEINKEKV